MINPKLETAIENHPVGTPEGLADHFTGRRGTTSRANFILKVLLTILISWKCDLLPYGYTLGNAILWYWIGVAFIVWFGYLTANKRVRIIAKEAGVRKRDAAKHC